MDPFLQNIVILISAAAGAVVALGMKITHRQLCALISFAAGALLATTFFHIIPEAVGFLGIPGILLALLSGYLLFYLISRYFSHVCPACSASHFEEHTTTEIQRMAFLLAVALGIHVIMDGIAIALGHELKGGMDLPIFLSLTIHKFPEGLALCGLLIKSGFNKTKSFLATLALESLTFAGWMIGLHFLESFAMGAWFYGLLVHIGGGFVYLALHALLNESKKHSPVLIIVFFGLGFALVWASALLGG